MELLETYIYQQLDREKVENLISRNADEDGQILDSVSHILELVKKNGDDAIRALSLQYDDISLDRLYLEQSDIQAMAMKIGRQEQRALEIAFSNIHRFHSIQSRKERAVETMPGVKCWREPRPIEKVGLYIPGGNAILPSTLLMLGVPARIAGCKQIIVCSPPQPGGGINPYIAYCLHLLNIDRIYLAGGAQAIGAMAYGTESIPRVDKIYGPGNQYVTTAKTLVQQQAKVAIDMPAGPSEVLIIADQAADPAFVASDLLAQAEHGTDSQAILVTDSTRLISQVNEALQRQLSELPRMTIAQKALSNSFALLVENMDQAMQFSNLYAPEHLILSVQESYTLTPKILHAGSVFIGPYSAESIGDYASGTNHTLPTSGYARSYSGVSVESFLKKITFQEINEQGLRQIGPVVEILASMEGLDAHKNAVSIRLKSLS